ncbi:hypothetical protein ACFL1K_01685 [Candidatus Omnitrophota bacterium]
MKTDTTELSAKAIVPCIPPFIYGLIRLFRYSSNDWEGWTLVIGALLSFVGIITFLAVTIDNKRSWRNMLFTFMVFLPYPYGCFVGFYEGSWSVRFLIASFSWGNIIRPIIWMAIGYQIVEGMNQLREYGKSQ